MDVPIAADESICCAGDPWRWRPVWEAADVVSLVARHSEVCVRATQVACKSGLSRRVLCLMPQGTSISLSVGVAAAATVPSVPRQPD